MSFGGRTPESLLPRSDSKNPATTCKGITTNGRPCRRALAQTSCTSPSPSPTHGHGVLAVLDGQHGNGVSPAAFYCWQHKHQVEQILDKKTTTIVDLADTNHERRSIDTLVDRLGILDLEEESRDRVTRRHKDWGRATPVKKRDTMPAGWHDMQSPLMTVPKDLVKAKSARRSNKEYGRSNVKASFLCCIRSVEEEDMPPVRHRQNQLTRRFDVDPMNSKPARQAEMSESVHKLLDPTSGCKSRDPTRKTYNNNNNNTNPSQARLQASLPSRFQTQTLLSLIPSHLPPTTTSALLTELSKPISSSDEPGYIYMFWLTPDTTHSKPDDDAATSLLDSDDEDPDIPPQRSSRQRLKPSKHHQTELLTRYASTSTRHHCPTNPSSSSPSPRKTILLKIGRAQNVHRRLSQWSKQCGHNITLIRWYPHSPSHLNPLQKPTPQAQTPRQVPNVTRVERLIHLELAGRNLHVQQEKCEKCGRAHREWFEVAATREGVREVDRVIGRWVGWGQRGGLGFVGLGG